MCRLLLTFTLFLLSQTAFSQSYVKLSAGAAIPLGDYSNNQVEAPGAEVGVALGLEGAWLPGPVGLRVAIGLAANAGRDDYIVVVNQQLGALRADSYDPGVHAAIWGFIGPAFQAKSEAVTLDFHLGLGYMTYGTPEQELVVGPVTSTQPLVDVGAFAGSAGAGARFHLTPMFALYIGGEFIMAEPEPTVTATARAFGVLPETQTATYEQSFMLINANFGFCLNLP